MMGGVEPRNGGGEGSHAIQCGGIAGGGFWEGTCRVEVRSKVFC